jgi:hypothetical protein
MGTPCRDVCASMSASSISRVGGAAGVDRCLAGAAVCDAVEEVMGSRMPYFSRAKWEWVWRGLPLWNTL